MSDQKLRDSAYLAVAMGDFDRKQPKDASYLFDVGWIQVLGEKEDGTFEETGRIYLRSINPTQQEIDLLERMGRFPIQIKVGEKIFLYSNA